jgi:hypothetical protein
MMWLTTQRRQHPLPVVAMCIGGHEILSVSTARKIGVYFDFLVYACMRRHLDVVTARRFAMHAASTVRHTSVISPSVLPTLGDVTRDVEARLLLQIRP